ncbi:MAG: helix-turn-helix domain-containing protein [Bacteroidetes bacterium]|jgi:AraC-like DNA-binding protein|nr:helix-turn-helix domain-containing protein [Bacteroidota bacterium]
MEYCIAKSSLALSQWVKCYWTIDNCLPSNVQYVHRIVPHGLAELSFYFDKTPASLNQNISISESTNIAGQLSCFYDLKISRRLSMFSIIFQPAGLYSFFNIPVSEFYNQQIPLRYILKETTSELELKLHHARSFASRILIAEQFLLHQLRNNNKTSYHNPRIQNSIALINQSKGRVNINYLATQACLSRKQFERIFLKYIGISPGRFMKIVRFQHAIHEKSINNNINLTELSYKCGYFDQSHMTNDFMQLAGMNPKKYFSECNVLSDYFG